LGSILVVAVQSVMEITVLVDQAPNFVIRSHGTPAVVNALAGEREVKAEIDSGMRFGIFGDFREPWAGHQRLAEFTRPLSRA